MGVNVYGAGAAGANLICPYIHIVDSTTFTLWTDTAHSSACNAGTTVNGNGVAHDDTKAFQDAIATGDNIHIANGSYAVTSELVPMTGTAIEGENRRATMIVGGSATANVFTLTNPFTTLRNFGIVGSNDVTRTAGCAIQTGAVGRGTGQSNIIDVSRMDIWYMNRGICELEGTYQAWVTDILIVSGATGSGPAILVDNPFPNGDVHWSGIEIGGGSAEAGIKIIQADTQSWTNIKSNGGSPSLLILPGTNNTVYNQRFVNGSFENGAPTIVDIDSTSSNGSVRGVEFVGGQMGTGDATNTVKLTGAAVDSVSFTGVRFYPAAGNGMNINAATNIPVTGCTFYNSGVVTSGAAADLRFLGNTFNGTGSISIDSTVTSATVWGNKDQANFIKRGQYASQKYTSADTSIDWNDGNVQYFVLANDSQNITFSNPQDGGRYMLILKQPASGNAGTVGTWGSSNVLWPAGVAPTLTATNSKTDIVTFVYDGTNSKYLGGASLNY
jgi:hypothetical protein